MSAETRNHDFEQGIGEHDLGAERRSGTHTDYSTIHSIRTTYRHDWKPTAAPQGQEIVGAGQKTRRQGRGENRVLIHRHLGVKRDRRG